MTIDEIKTRFGVSCWFELYQLVINSPYASDAPVIKLESQSGAAVTMAIMQIKANAMDEVYQLLPTVDDAGFLMSKGIGPNLDVPALRRQRDIVFKLSKIAK